MRALAPPGTSLHKLVYVGIQHHAIPSFPRKRESRAVSGALALGARFRGHDEKLGSSYVHFCNEVLVLVWPSSARGECLLLGKGALDLVLQQLGQLAA